MRVVVEGGKGVFILPGVWERRYIHGYLFNIDK